MGMRDTVEGTAAEQLDKDLRQTQATVRSIHERVYFRPLLEAFAGADAEDAALSPEAAAARLTAFGFVDARRTQAAVKELTRGLNRSSRLMQQLLPLLLDWLSQAPDPDLGLLLVRNLLTSGPTSRSLAETFRDSPAAAQSLCTVAGTSRLLGEILTHNPDLVARLPDPARLATRDRDGLVTTAEAALGMREGRTEQQGSLRRWQQRNLLGMAGRDLLGHAQVHEVGNDLTSLAEATLEAALAALEPTIPFAVIGLGRFGGAELAYASDLDVIFVHDAQGASGTDEAKRLATALMRYIGGTTPADRIYDIDADLRPEGRSGPLARSLGAFDVYWREHALTWERQAMTRARVVAGDRALGDAAPRHDRAPRVGRRPRRRGDPRDPAHEGPDRVGAHPAGRGPRLPPQARAGLALRHRVHGPDAPAAVRREGHRHPRRPAGPRRERGHGRRRRRGPGRRLRVLRAGAQPVVPREQRPRRLAADPARAAAVALPVARHHARQPARGLPPRHPPRPHGRRAGLLRPSGALTPPAASHDGRFAHRGDRWTQPPSGPSSTTPWSTPTATSSSTCPPCGTSSATTPAASSPTGSPRSPRRRRCDAGLDVETKRAHGLSRTGWWGVPARNTLDRATAMLPGLLYERLDELGIDVAVLYPTVGLTVMAIDDDEMRRAIARACNRYYAEAYGPYSDRLITVGVIPTYDPDEAIAELDHATGELGLKGFLFGGLVLRPAPGHEGDRTARWVDGLGLDSAHDYDPLWQRCSELGVSPTFHSTGIGFGSRVSPTNYVANHIGNFAAGTEAVCRSLFFGGAMTRFPELRFAFLEGGVAWACNLLADLVSHFEKRNIDALAHYDPRNLDRAQLDDLMARYADGLIAERTDRLDETLGFLSDPDEDPATLDEWAPSGIGSVADIVRVFTEQCFFGCEADDPMNALAFDSARSTPRAPACGRCSPPTSATGTSRTSPACCPRPGSWSRTASSTESSSATSCSATSCGCSPGPTPSSSPAPRSADEVTALLSPSA